MHATRNPPKGLIPRLKHIARKHRGPLGAVVIAAAYVLVGSMDFADQVKRNEFHCEMVAERYWPKASTEPECPSANPGGKE